MLNVGVSFFLLTISLIVLHQYTHHQCLHGIQFFVSHCLPSVSSFVRVDLASMSLPILATVAPVVSSQLDAIKTKVCESVVNEPAVIGHLDDQLHCQGLITSAVQKAVKFVDGKSPYDKADAVISPAIEHVRSDPGRSAPAHVRVLDNVGLGSVITVFSLTASGK